MEWMVCHSEEQVLNAASIGRIAKGLTTDGG